MWDFLTAALSAIPSAAQSAYAFSAYALAIVAYVISVWRVARNKTLLENIQKLPPQDRLSALEVEIGGVRLAEGISPEQWVRSRIHKYYMFAFLATCAVVTVIGAIALHKGGSEIKIYQTINNEYRSLSNGATLSESDVQHLKELIDAMDAGGVAKASAAFRELSETARRAYERAYPLTKDKLVSPDQLKSADRPPSEVAPTQSKQGQINLLSQKNGGKVIFSSSSKWMEINDDRLERVLGSSDLGSPKGEVIFRFKDSRPAAYDKFAVYLPEAYGWNPKDIELFAGDEGASGSFRSLRIVTLMNGRLEDGWQEFRLPETTSKFFKVKILSNVGGGVTTNLYGLQLYGVLK